MSTILKPVLAFIISALLLVGAAFLAETELMDYVLTRFYNPSILNSLVVENSAAAEIIREHISALQTKFSDTLEAPSIRSSFNFNQNSEDIFERSRIFGILQEAVSGLQSVQFVDSNGIRIHFSTSNRDILRQSGDSVTFRNYTEDTRALPFDLVSVGAYEPPKFTMDDSRDRIIFSFPFYDSMDVYRGTALFNLSVRSLAEKLIAENRLKPTDDISVIRIPPGVVFGSPETSTSVILDKVASFWNEGLKEFITFTAEDSGEQFALISTKTDKNIFFGRIINNSIFSVSTQMKRVFEISIFLTFFLTIYFFINLKPNSVSVVQSRIKKLRTNLFEQLYVKRTPEERTKWILELDQRREGIRAELKHKLKIKPKQENKINNLIDTTLDELLAVIKSGAAVSPALISAKKENKKNIEEKAPLGETKELGEAEPLDKIKEAESIDELEEVEPLDEVNELEEAEPLEEVDELEEVEPLDEVNELEEVEPLEEVDELEEAEPLDEIDELKEVEPLEEADELEEVEPLDEVNELEEVEPLEEVDELEEAEPLEEADELEEVEPLDEVNELEEVEPLEKADELEEAEPLEEVDELEEAEPLEEVDELEEVEPLDEVNELEEAEPLEEVNELEEVEPLEEVNELEEVEPLEEVDELEEVEPLEKVDELEEAEPLEEVNELEEVEPLEEVDELEEAEPLDEVVELKESGELIESDEETIPEHTLSPQTKDSQTVEVKSPAAKGLLSAASKSAYSQKIEKTEPAVSASPAKGLLGVASKIAETKDEEKTSKELSADNENNKPAKKPASREHIIEAAREIEFSDKYLSKPEEEQDLNIEMEIVSPFSNMFSSLDDEE